MMMRHVESGGFDMVYQVKGAFEVKELSHSFTRMVHQIKNLMEDLRNEQEQILKDQVQLSAIEMKFLHAQLNPHFLYNTLDSVVWLAESGNQKSVVKMTEALSNYFRLSLSGGDDVITLENELKHTENYLIIQKMRYNEQFDYSIENELIYTEYMTIKNIIQPIVENSIVHGVANMLDQCYISVRVYSEDQKLIVKVKDNGSGISPATLRKILDPKPGSKSGIGIYNVNKRIQLMYGNEYGLKYESEPDEGTTVYIIQPLETKA
jgi:two-component system sensor histidine kinase YesM